jgi:hypothetical protein
VELFFTESINWWVNFSEETYRTVLLGNLFLIAIPIACPKWVFPSPTPP